MAAVHWADLPGPALSLISEFLPCPIDYIRFRSVCASWRSSAPKRPQLPFLAGHRIVDNETNTILDFYRFTGSHISPVDNGNNLPKTPLAGLCRGSSHGWMAFLTPTPGFTLWNPVTKSQIRLPDLTYVPSRYKDTEDQRISKRGDEFVFRVGEEEYTTSFWESKSEFGSKLILSSDPATDPNCVALLLCCRWKRVLVCNLGDDSWTPVRFEHFRSFNADALFYKGRFHILSGTDLYALNLGLEPELEPFHMAETRLDLPSTLVELDEGYLIELDGELVAVYLSYGSAIDFCSHSFEIYKVNWGLHGVKLQKLKSLGDHAIFIGLNQSVSLWARGYPGCRANCIYMVEYYQERPMIEPRVRICDLEACISESSKFGFLRDKHWTFCKNDFIDNLSVDPSSDWMPCAWILPSLL